MTMAAYFPETYLETLRAPTGVSLEQKHRLLSESEARAVLRTYNRTQAHEVRLMQQVLHDIRVRAKSRRRLIEGYNREIERLLRPYLLSANPNEFVYACGTESQSHYLVTRMQITKKGALQHYYMPVACTEHALIRAIQSHRVRSREGISDAIAELVMPLMMHLDAINPQPSMGRTFSAYPKGGKRFSVIDEAAEIVAVIDEVHDVVVPITRIARKVWDWDKAQKWEPLLKKFEFIVEVDGKRVNKLCVPRETPSQCHHS